MSDVFGASGMAGLAAALKAATPVELAVVAAILGGLYLIYTQLRG
jgi:hypothetical protein